MINAIIIEDEELARAGIKSYLSKYFEEIEVIGEFEGVQDALRFLPLNEVEIIFLDVQLKDGLGTELLKKIDTQHYRIVFITAHEDYAMDAFKHKAFGYLLKPLDPEDFQEIINRVILDIKINPKEKMIKVPISESNVWMKTSEIVRCESQSNYSIIYTVDKSYIISKTLKFVEIELINSTQFVRIHQSHLINLKFVMNKEIKHNTIELSTGDLIPVSRSKKDALIEAFNTL